MVSPLARSATAKPAICAGVASPARISPIAQAVWSAVRSVPRDQRGEHLGPRVARSRSVPGRSAAAGRDPRARAARTTASASCSGSIGCGHGAVGARPGGQPGVLRAAGQHQDRRAAGRSRPSSAWRCPSRRRARPRRRGSRGRSVPESICCSTTGSVATSTYSASGRSGCGRRPRARITWDAGVGVVAVDEDLERLGGGGVRHAGDSTGTASRAPRPAPRAGRAGGPRAPPRASTSGPTG